MISTSEELDKKVDFQEIYHQLIQLSQFIIDETIDRLFGYLKEKKEDLFKEKVEKASKYKDGYILKLFLARLRKERNIKLDDSQKRMVNYIKDILAAFS